MNFENTLISALRDQKMVEIQFRKETDRDLVDREVAPYDVYDKQDKNGYSRRVLLGYCWEHKDYEEDPIYIYLDSIESIRSLNTNFDGQDVKRLINPKKLPNIPRSW